MKLSICSISYLSLLTILLPTWGGTATKESPASIRPYTSQVRKERKEKRKKIAKGNKKVTFLLPVVVITAFGTTVPGCLYLTRSPKSQEEPKKPANVNPTSKVKKPVLPKSPEKVKETGGTKSKTTEPAKVDHNQEEQAPSGKTSPSGGSIPTSPLPTVEVVSQVQNPPASTFSSDAANDIDRREDDHTNAKGSILQESGGSIPTSPLPTV